MNEKTVKFIKNAQTFFRGALRGRGVRHMKGWKNIAGGIITGAAVGAANGIFGGGGGMIAVPLLSGMMGLGGRSAHATAILVIAPVCLASAVVYVVSGYASLPVIIPSAIGMTAGGVLGAKLLGGLPLSVVRLIFVAVMLAAGIRMVLP